MVSRTLGRRQLVTPDPSKRPKSSCIRFAAELPDECWPSDFAHYPLASGADCEILTWLDDHSRYALSVTAHQRVTGPAVLTAFRVAVAAYGAPASTLTDNGLVFTTRFAGGRGGRNALEAELSTEAIRTKVSRSAPSLLPESDIRRRSEMIRAAVRTADLRVQGWS